jgi:hypothetical protein
LGRITHFLPHRSRRDEKQRHINGLRRPLLAHDVPETGPSRPEINSRRRYPDLEREDLPEALRYAADAVRERELPLVSS